MTVGLRIERRGLASRDRVLCDNFDSLPLGSPHPKVHTALGNNLGANGISSLH
jgi:hypothetical protein